MYDVETLELPKVLNEVQKYASSPLAKIKLSSLEIKNDIEEIRLMLEETEEARLLQIKYGELPFGGLFDLTNVINRLRLKSVLSIIDFLDLENMLYCTRNILSFNQTNLSKEKVLYLNNYFSLLNPLKKVSEKINNIINENGEIYDHASDELASIRKKIKTLDNQVRAKMQELLQTKAKMLNESLIVIRNDRMCLCVKSEYKHVLKGIIHDESSSGSTVYIEPYSALEISNRLVGYKEDEKREINKILSELSQFVWAYYEEIRTNYENLTILDVIYAKAKYAIYHNAYKPEVNDMGIIDLKLAKHPLIPQDRCVPINVKLGDAYQAIIITGPNTGGKTVALKTTGLLTLMTQCGLLIPANEGSKVAIFKQILADIGDEQSIEQSLSSFSAHMTKVIKILNNLGHKALVLFDELGSGTDPKEGSNLAIAITEYLLERNARIIVTTHYADLKAFAYHNDKVINASVEFDTATLKPTYRLLLGVPGSSNALTIAKRLGLNEEIILKANDLNTENESDLATMLRHLDEENTRLTKEIKAYEEKNQEVNLLKEKLTKKEAEYDAKYQSFLKKSQAEANRILEKAKQEAMDLLDEISKLKNRDIKEHEISDLKYIARNLTPEMKVEETIHEFVVGEEVLVKAWNQIGKINRINKDNYEVQMGQFAMTFKKNDLAIFKGEVNKPKTVKKKPSTGTIPKREGKLECDLRGFRYEEVKPELEKFIDQAYLNGFSQIYIIHGFGTGAVRKAVYEYLKKCPYVKETRFGGEGEGLNGVTVCYLK